MSSKGTRRSTLEPGTFASQLGAYTWHLVDQARGDQSGRWLAKRTDRSSEYWRKILTGNQAMTTNDIQIIAELFEVNPYQLIRDAMSWGTSPQESSPGVVGAARDTADLHEIDLRQSHFDLAATHDTSSVEEQSHPKYEDENQDHPENE